MRLLWRSRKIFVRPPSSCSPRWFSLPRWARLLRRLQSFSRHAWCRWLSSSERRWLAWSPQRFERCQRSFSSPQRRCHWFFGPRPDWLLWRSRLFWRSQLSWGLRSPFWEWLSLRSRCFSPRLRPLVRRPSSPWQRSFSLPPCASPLCRCWSRTFWFLRMWFFSSWSSSLGLCQPWILEQPSTASHSPQMWKVTTREMCHSGAWHFCRTSRFFRVPGSGWSSVGNQFLCEPLDQLYARFMGCADVEGRPACPTPRLTRPQHPATKGAGQDSRVWLIQRGTHIRARFAELSHPGLPKLRLARPLRRFLPEVPHETDPGNGQCRRMRTGRLRI